MKIAKIVAGLGLICAMVLLAATASEQQEQQAKQSKGLPETVSVPGCGELALAGPFTHKNLSIYILYRKEKPGKEPAYITLEEGTKAGMVKITEMQQEQVGRLVVSNNSDKRLFLHAGELVRGGKQDRMLQTSLVIPPNSPKAPIPSFCVEQSRWSGKVEFSSTGMNAPGWVSNNANYQRDQNAVWEQVRVLKSRARRSVTSQGATTRPSRTSSVNEELGDKDFKKLTEAYQSALAKATKHLPCPLGFAYAVNGEINVVDIYHANSLFEKLFPRLLKTSAAAAAVEQRTDKEKQIKHPTARDVANFIKAAWDGEMKKEELAYGNVFIRLSNKKALTGQLFFKGKLIHAQVVKNDPGAATRPSNTRPQVLNIQSEQSVRQQPRRR